MPHKHTIPAPEAADELAELVTLALICATASPVLRRRRADQHIRREPASEALSATVRVDGCRDTGRRRNGRKRDSGQLTG